MRKALLTASLLAVVACAPPAAAMTDAECSAAFRSVDKNSDGVLSETEAGRYFAALRVASKPVMNGTLPQADFMSNCKQDAHVYSETVRRGLD